VLKVSSTPDAATWRATSHEAPFSPPQLPSPSDTRMIVRKPESGRSSSAASNAMWVGVLPAGSSCATVWLMAPRSTRCGGISSVPPPQSESDGYVRSPTRAFESTFLR